MRCYPHPPPPPLRPHLSLTHGRWLGGPKKGLKKV